MRRLLLAALLAGAAAPAAHAQVGHAPGTSPYRDISASTGFTAWGGYLFGSGGRYGVGPQRGAAYGLKYSFRANKFIQLDLGGGRIQAERLIANPFVAVVDRYTGPVNQDVYFGEVGFQFNLTGGKTWHRLAPYAGFGLGIAFAQRTTADTSGYNFGRKFLWTPNAGVRVFLTPGIALKLEGKLVGWKLSYPTIWATEPVLDPGTPTAPNAIITNRRFSQWTFSPLLSAGLSLPIRLL